MDGLTVIRGNMLLVKWHSRGQRFDPACLHQNKGSLTGKVRLLYLSWEMYVEFRHAIPYTSEVGKMNDVIMDTLLLPEQISKHIKTPKVKVQVTGDVVSILPVREPTDIIDIMYGMFKGGSMSVDRFLESKEQERNLTTPSLRDAL